MAEVIAFPPVAVEKINAFRFERELLEAKLQQFIDGLIIGLGIDVTNNDIGVDLDAMTATVRPKENK